MNKLNENQKIILEEIKKNPKITQWELSRILYINERSVRRNIWKLKQRGIVKRIGPNYRGSGHWEILKNDSRKTN